MSKKIKDDAPIRDATETRRTRVDPGPGVEGEAWVATGFSAAVGSDGVDPVGSSAARESPGGFMRVERLVADCPARPVDWRWRRAGLPLDLEHCRRGEERPTREAGLFRAALARCRDEADCRRLEARLPGVAGAYALHSGPPASRWAVEARILAGEPAAEIARKQGTTVVVVALYESLFFNVGDRLDSGGYIAHAAIGRPVAQGIGPGDAGWFWRFLGYHAGPAMLDAAIAAIAAWAAGSASAEQVAFLAELMRLRDSLTPNVPARTPRRRSSRGSAQAPRRRKRQSAGPPPAGLPIEEAGPSGDAGPECPTRARTRGRRQARAEPGRDDVPVDPFDMGPFGHESGWP